MTAVPALAWVPLFAASANRALDGDLRGSELVPREDPLQWVLVLTVSGQWTALSSGFIRQLLVGWAEVNNATVASSGIAKQRFRWTALLLIRGLGPPSAVDPYAAEGPRPLMHQLPRRK